MYAMKVFTRGLLSISAYKKDEVTMSGSVTSVCNVKDVTQDRSFTCTNKSRRKLIFEHRPKICLRGVFTAVTKIIKLR